MADKFDELMDQFGSFGNKGNGGFGDILDGLVRPSAKPEPKKSEKGLPWAAKTIDGEYYVPLSQVVELLESNDVLPAVRKGLQARVDAKRMEGK